MLTGTIKFYNEDKGYGFITRDDGNGDTFLHVRELKKANIDEVEKGDKLQFEIESTPKGHRAFNVARA